MSGTIQTYMADSTRKAATALIEAIEALPAEKRAWSPLDKGRSALDQAAECAIINGGISNLLKAKKFPENFDMEAFMKQKVELAGDWDTLKTLLETNTNLVATSISEVQDSELSEIIELPWGPKSVSEIIAMPHWNMAYHEGQTNYISTISG